jgi:hypothetical protein
MGLGRSGTHLLANIIKSGLPTDIEVQPQFNLVLDAVVWGKPIDQLKRIYESKPKNYATKDHPIIWLVEGFRYLKPKFVCIERDVNQVVASSLLHDGVRQWVTDDYPPNPLSANYVPGYAEMNTVERLALRWLVNHQRINELKSTNQGDILFLDYNDLVVNTAPTVHQLELFLDVKLQIPKIRKNSMNKYLTVLTQTQLDQIRGVLNDSPCLL